MKCSSTILEETQHGCWTLISHEASTHHPRHEKLTRGVPQALSIISLKKATSKLQPNIWRQVKLMTERLSLRLSAIFNNLQHSYTSIIAFKLVLVSLVLEQVHSYGSLTETLMRVFNMAVTTKHLPLMTVLWRHHQSFVLWPWHTCAKAIFCLSEWYHRVVTLLFLEVSGWTKQWSSVKAAWGCWYYISFTRVIFSLL